MKKASVFFVLILFCTAFAFTQQSDEERLDTLIDSARDKKAQYQKDKEEKQKEEKSEKELVETKTVTTITVTTQITTVQKEKEPVNEPVYVHHSGRIGVGTLILAEFLGAITPGLGMAHFTVGDTRGGLFTLGMTGVALITYISAEILIETRTIDDPLTYGIMHYGSMALYGAAILYDLIGTPVYVMDYNRNYTAQISTLKPRVSASPQGTLSLGMDVLSIELSF